MTRLRFAVLVALALTSLVSAGAAAAPSKLPAGVFVSLVPACACSGHTELELFSASSGRRIRRVTALAPMQTGNSLVQLSPATTRGRLLLTIATGPHCDTPPGTVSAECPHYIPGSCTNTVSALSPGQSAFSALFTVSGSQLISNVVPNPAGDRVALTMTPCIGIHGITGLFVRSLRSGRTSPVVTSQNRCDGYGPTAWNPQGTELAFILNRAKGKPIPIASDFACPTSRDYLALASAHGGNSPEGLQLIRPDHGCLFRAVAFDSAGVVAAEGCNRDSPPNQGRGYLGQAVLVQYSSKGKALTRKLLEHGLEDATIAPQPRTGVVLVTQDQPANTGYPQRDWVWSFDGRNLRPIANYAAHDIDQILAIPW